MHRLRPIQRRVGPAVRAITHDMEQTMSAPRSPTTITEMPLVHFGREICGSLDDGLRREWLVTNGLGSYASSTLAGINTRSYHGLLVAALNPPVDRTVLVGGMVEWVTYDGHRYPLSANEYAGGTIDPQGYRYMQSFALKACFQSGHSRSATHYLSVASGWLSARYDLCAVSSAARQGTHAARGYTTGDLSQLPPPLVWTGLGDGRRVFGTESHHTRV